MGLGASVIQKDDQFTFAKVQLNVIRRSLEVQTVECWHVSRMLRQRCFPRRFSIGRGSRMPRGRARKEIQRVCDKCQYHTDIPVGAECESYSELPAEIPRLVTNLKEAVRGSTNRPEPFPAFIVSSF